MQIVNICNVYVIFTSIELNPMRVFNYFKINYLKEKSCKIILHKGWKHKDYFKIDTIGGWNELKLTMFSWAF